MKVYENSHSSPVPEVASSADTCSDGDASAPSNGSLTPQLYLHNDRMKAFSRLSRFGMTFGPLTGSLGAELLTWYLEAFPVRTFQQLERGLELPEKDPACGKKWRGSLARYDRDTSSWRTVQYSLLGDLELFLETWPRSGTMRSGMCSRLNTSAPHISEREFGYWPTPVKTDNKGFSASSMKWKAETGLRPSGAKIGTCLRWFPQVIPFVSRGRINPILHQWLMGWPYGFTNLQPLETDKFRQWSDLHGIHFTNGSPTDNNTKP